MRSPSQYFYLQRGLAYRVNATEESEKQVKKYDRLYAVSAVAETGLFWTAVVGMLGTAIAIVDKTPQNNTSAPSAVTEPARPAPSSPLTGKVIKKDF